MFYIVETNEQLEELFNKSYDKVFIELIYFNDYIHPALNHISLLYLKPLNNDKGYILCLDHNEALSLNKTPINNLLASYEEIYVRNRKSFIYDFPLRNTVDISFETPEYHEPSTPSHDFFYQRHSDKENINTIIPVVKHYERCELIFEQVKKYCFKRDNTKFHNKLTSAFFAIEKNGIKINEELFETYFDPNNSMYSVCDGKIYTQYNLYTTTGRPSNSFNGINFAALGKHDGVREVFVPENDCFIEMDVNGMHPNILCMLVNYKFKEKDIHESLAKIYGVSREEGKKITFKQLYGGISEEYKDVEFFQLVQKYILKTWKEFNESGSITLPISGHCFKKDKLKDMNPQKLINYIIQSTETTINTLVLWEILLKIKKFESKIILYVYDSILVDAKNKEIKDIINIVEQEYEKLGFYINVKIGNNYNNLVSP